MARKVIWSANAQEDRKAIFTYWNNNNKSKVYSRKLNRLFNEAIERLKSHPFASRKTIIPNVHVKIVRQYLIVYEVTEIEIIIHTIWDGRRNPDELLIN
jgi:addiction module RelE/StbE family toxin